MTGPGHIQLHGLFPNRKHPAGGIRCAMAQARRVLPTLRERLQVPDEPAADQLLQRLERLPDSKAAILLAHTLSSVEILYLFPLLARLASQQKNVPELISRLHLLIRERACPSMYQSGWIIFQQHYHQPVIGKAFSLLCSILEIRQIRQTDPELHLISEIIRPDRQTVIRDLMRAIADQQLALADLAAQYHLADDLPLYQELAASALLRGNSHQFAAAASQFSVIFTHADSSLQIRLLRRLFKFWSIPPQVRNLCCQTVYRQIGAISDDHVVWQKIKKKHQRQFNRWLTSARIGSHCRHQPERARLYLRYEAQIERIEAWDEQTLLIYLPSGMIADSHAEPDAAVFYDLVQARRWLEKTAEADRLHPLSPMIPKRRVDEAIRRGSCRGVIGLPFDQEGIRYTKIFLDFCLQKHKRPSGGQSSSQQVRRSD